MTDAASAVGMDRLPWLDDEPVRRAEPRRRTPKPRGQSSLREYAGWGVAAALLVAGGSYWLGSQSSPAPDRQPVEAAPGGSASTVKLPEPNAAIPPVAEEQPASEATPNRSSVREKAAAPARPRQPTVARERTLTSMEMKNSDLSKTIAAQEQAVGPAEEKASEQPKVEPAPPPPVAKTKPLASREQLKLWPARVSSGASGRLVQIGAFGSRQQAKLGWRRMKRSYPAVARLPAVVVESRNSRGKRFYRFQIGTTSQAHSEVLCQRMRSIKFSCAVVGLPWKSKVER